MKFNNGYFGACICVLALLGTASCGFFLNIEKDTREVTNYEYTADVSGLFSYTDAPEYIDYNPSSNLVGYDSNIIYTPASVVNNYRYIVTEGSPGTKTLTIDGNSSFPNDYITGLPTNGFHSHLINYSGSYDFGTGWTPSGSSYGGNSFNGYVDLETANAPIVTKLTNVLNAMDLSGVDRGEIQITNSGVVPLMCVWADSTWYLKNTNSIGTMRYYYMADLSDNNIPTSIKFDTTSLIVTVYHNSDVLYNGPSDGVGIVYHYHVSKYWSSNANPMNWDLVSCNTNLSMDYFTPPTYGYMNPNAGVKATSTEATWSNGYHNNIIDIKVIKNGDANTYPQTLVFTIGTSTIHLLYGGHFMSGVNGQSPYDDLGAWLGVQVRIDGSNGSVTVTPTNDLNMLTTVEPTDYSKTYTNVFTPGDIDSFTVKTAPPVNETLKFQVTGTKVFLNTYNTVMVDPSINVGNYFPGYSEYRLNFYSFAILGDSMTINNQVCPVDKDDATITFRNVANLEFTKKLANIYLTFQDGHTYLTFVNDSSVYDLGETVNTVVSFSGMWYFTTGLYKAVDGVESFWNLDLDGMFHATAGECLIIFIGIIGLGTIVYTVWGRGKLGSYDWIVIIFSIFLGSCLLGF